MAVIFLFKYTQNFAINNHQKLGEYLDTHIQPLVSKLSKNQAGFQHLQFTGCGSISLSGNSLEGVFSTIYHGQFLKGFDQSEIDGISFPIKLDSLFFIPCLNDPLKLQVNANSLELLEKLLDAKKVSSNDRTKIF